METRTPVAIMPALADVPKSQKSISPPNAQNFRSTEYETIKIGFTFLLRCPEMHQIFCKWQAAMHLIFWLVVLSCLMVGQAPAQGGRVWETIEIERGIGQGTCPIQGQAFDCLVLRCAVGRGLELAYLTNHTNYTARRETVLIDGQPVAEIDLSGVADGYAVSVLDNEPLLDAMKSGGKLFLASLPGIPFTLSGSTRAIEAAKGDCLAYDRSMADAPPGDGKALRLSDETASDILGAGGQTNYSEHRDTDIWGFDLEDWVDNPLAENVSLNQCKMLCMVTNQCVAFTYNDQLDTCILKSEVGPFKSYTGAITGVIERDNQPVLPPPTNGPGLSIMPESAWRQGETIEAYYDRLRAISKPLGGACEAEEASLRALADEFDASVVEAIATVGSALDVSWSGNTLSDRLPVWLVVSSPQPVRFAGRGFFALPPGPIAPFGLTHANDSTRAFSALFARGSNEIGSLGVVPLVAGKMNLNVSLLAYLRACEREVVLESRSYEVVVAPAAPQIVLASSEGSRAFGARIDIGEFERVVTIADDRYRIETSDGTEIVERQGSSLTVSPTRRFVAVDADDRIEIVDVVDGAVVGTVDEGLLRWALADAFAISDNAPWATVSIASTYSPSSTISRQLTGPSCCYAGNKTGITINLENALLGIWGNLGYGITALQNDAYSVGSNPDSGYASDGSLSPAILKAIVASIGPVAPLSISQTPNLVGGANDYFDDSQPSKSTIGDTRESQVAFLQGMGLPVQTLQTDDVVRLATNDAGSAAIYRSEENAVDAEDSLINQMSRIGVSALEGTMASVEAIGGAQSWVVQAYAEDGIGSIDQAIAEFDAERGAAGYEFEWFDPEASGMDTLYCEHIGAGDGQLPSSVDLIEKVEQARGNVWVVRLGCLGGPTMGSQTGTSMLMIFDLSQPFSGVLADYVVADNHWFAGTLVTTFYEFNFRSKLFGRMLVLFGPSSGKVGLFDLDRRKFISNSDTLANGDLLVDIFAVENRNHFIALGRDDSLAVFDGVSGKTVLSGRIADDEIIVWNNKYQFDSTAEGASLVELRFPGTEGQFSFQLFGRALRVENLAARTLAGLEILPPAPIGIPPEISGTLSTTDGRLAIEAQLASSDGLKRVLVYFDGTMVEEISASGLTARLVHDLARPLGARWASVVVEDLHGLVGRPLNIDLGRDPRGNSRLELMAVGIDYYTDRGLPSLNFAKGDAERFFEGVATVHQVNEPIILTDRGATPDAVLAGVEDLIGRIEPGGHGILFLAGHGLRGDDGEFYLGTSETDLDDLPGTALAWSRLASAVRDVRGRLTIVIDACHSGAATGDYLATNDDAVNALSGLDRGNITVIAASKGRELSGEDGEVGGGVFTQALVQVMTTDRILFDVNENGVLEASEVYNGTKQLVVQRRAGAQTPWMSGNPLVGQYALF